MLTRADGAALHGAFPAATAEGRLRYPRWTYLTMGCRPKCIDPAIFLAGKTIAGTVLDLLTQPAGLQGRVQ